MKATANSAIYAQLNSSLIGRAVLAMGAGYEQNVESQFPDTALKSMAGVFEQLAAEITAKTLEIPGYSIGSFARLLIAEAESIAEPEESLEPEETWCNHPSLTAEQRNSSF